MKSNNQIFNRRIFILTLIQVLLFLILIVRLFYLQVKENYYFKNLSEKNRINLVPIIPKRGLIYDKFKNQIAGNIFLWEVLFIKSQITQNINLFVDTVSSIIFLTQAEKSRILDDFKTKPSHYPILIKQNLSQSEIAAIETFSYNLPGVFIRPFYRRNYPYSDVFAHIIGYTSISNDLAKSNYVPHWQIGKYGLEESFDSFLKGEVGYSKYEVNAHGNVIRKLDQTASKSGNNVSLTIDALLQNKVYELLSQYNSASAVVTEIKTGNILAIASYPSFDPNLFAEGISEEIWKNFTENEKSPLSNKPLMGLYPPGSTIKPMLALQALQSKVIDTTTEFTCKGYLDVGRDRFHCWYKKGHGKVNLEKGIAQSCDIYFYNLAKLMTLTSMNDVAKNFGFSQKQLPIMKNEAKGRTVLNSSSFASDFQLGDQIVAMIGQGEWLATPIQLNRMITLLANGGNLFQYNILKNIEYEDKIIYPKANINTEKIPYNTEHINLIKNALFNTVNGKHGSGSLARTWNKNWILSGKTGTSQVRRISKQERKEGVLENHELPWNKRDHALFVGFVPFVEPLYSISVVVEHGGSAAFIAAPLARDIALFLKERHPYHIEDNEKIAKTINSIGS